MNLFWLHCFIRLGINWRWSGKKRYKNWETLSLEIDKKWKNISEQTQSQRSSTRTQVSCLIRLSRDKSLKSFAKMWPWRNNYGDFTVFVTSKSKLMMTANTELLCIICCSSVGVGDPFCTRTYYQSKVQIRKRNLTNYLIAFWHTTFNPVRYPDIRNKPIYSQFSFSLCTKALESIKIPGNW